MVVFRTAITLQNTVFGTVFRTFDFQLMHQLFGAILVCSLPLKLLSLQKLE